MGMIMSKSRKVIDLLYFYYKNSDFNSYVWI